MGGRRGDWISEETFEYREGRRLRRSSFKFRLGSLYSFWRGKNSRLVERYRAPTEIRKSRREIRDLRRDSPILLPVLSFLGLVS